MSRVAMRHLDEECLMRYADGELPARKAREVRSHLEACWQCRAELEELQETIKDCVRYRRALREHLPAPPARWMDIYPRMDEIDAAPERESLPRRIGRALALPARRWAPAAVALGVMCALVVHQWRETPSVEAAALLRKAVAAGDERPPAPRRIHIRTSRRQQASRVVAGPPEALDAAAAETMAGLEALFRGAGYSWEDPLSARSFQAWRDGLAGRRDEVAATDEHYRIRTTSDTGELMSATLKLDARDLRPVESRLEFRNEEWVEITELADAPAAPPAPVAVAGSGPSRSEERRGG